MILILQYNMFILQSFSILNTQRGLRNAFWYQISHNHIIIVMGIRPLR